MPLHLDEPAGLLGDDEVTLVVGRPLEAQGMRFLLVRIHSPDYAELTVNEAPYHVRVPGSREIEVDDIQFVSTGEDTLRMRVDPSLPSFGLGEEVRLRVEDTLVVRIDR